ncbi:MAG TPA: DnaJ domain-containing protein [Pyrinomonadaceae bacterium]|nr:DnaJ domain-containing protein [Pyrinomonadaceae bacterium]
MVNYYDILKVSPKASGAEIKSAYRRLARKLHPDKNQGSEETALKFAAIAEAYEVLGNPKERIKYDRRMVDAQFSGNGNGNGDSLFASTNPHAKRWRQMVYEKRYNDIIDRMIAEERNEAMAFQKVIYPAVALLVSCILAPALRPSIFGDSYIIGKIIVISLFIVGIIRIVGRVRDGFDRFTEPEDDIHESILDESERKRKPYSRLASAGMLIAAVLVCTGIGLLIGFNSNIGTIVLKDMSYPAFTLGAIEFVFYPPIVTFFVDGIHTIASKFER